MADGVADVRTLARVRRQLVAVGALGLAALAVTPASSCTTVCLLEKDRAVVAYNYGQLVAHHGATLPVRALTNSTYADSVVAFERARRAGEIPVSRSSLDRFVRAAILAGAGQGDPVGRGFEVLASVAQPDFTRWSIVYDLGAGEVHYQTQGNQAIRRINLASLDFSCGTPVRMLDVTTGSAGDMGAAFEDYTTSGMRALIESTFSKTPSLQPVPVAVRDAAAELNGVLAFPLARASGPADPAHPANP